MNEEELLAKAKSRYPVGTKFNSLGGFLNCEIFHNTEFRFEAPRRGGGRERRMIRVLVNNASHGIIYMKSSKEWAEIVSNPQSEKTELNYEIY
ncbi:MAG: hypothetical protein HRT87_11080 [Legionellales bacterium]|nr:hypothetical protein [Legionellales bacterium]